jgi:hypothetical protein
MTFGAVPSGRERQQRRANAVTCDSHASPRVRRWHPGFLGGVTPIALTGVPGPQTLPTPTLNVA